MRATLLSFTIFCPEQRDATHAPFYDAVEMYWKKKQIIIDPCPACNGRHVIELTTQEE